MKKVKRFVAAATMALATSSAMAAPIAFDPDGLGGLAGTINDVAAFDWAPGNVLARGGNAAIAAFITSGGTVRTPFTAFYQAKLSALRDSNNQFIPVPGLGTTFEISVVARFNESVDAVAAGSQTTIASFVNSASPDSYFEIYAHPVGALPLADDFGGVGFNDGIRILAGDPIITQSSFQISKANFQIVGGVLVLVPVPNQPLDNSPLNTPGNNDYPGLLTVTGSGGTNLQASIIPGTVNTDYFKVIPNTISLAFEGSQSVPFISTDPSSKFILQALTAQGAAPVTAGAGQFLTLGPLGELGTVNGGDLLLVGSGGGPSIQLQADGNSPISAINVGVPEPATAMLGLMGLAGLALRRRRNA